MSRDALYSACRLCPRACGVNRAQAFGFCRSGILPKVAHAALHFGEEPCISGVSGSGAVFFSGCTLRCCYCQNRPISAEGMGREITPRQLANIFLHLQGQGAHNLNLVTATHYIPSILDALDLIRDKRTIPVVYNTSGYESPETLRLLEGYVDIYLPDFKYWDSALASRLSAAPDYPQAAQAAILEMVRQTGPPQLDESGLLRKGVILRHLALPSLRQDTFHILEWAASHLGDSVLLSVMCQYTPIGQQDYAPLNRRLSTYEYRLILDKLDALGLHSGYVQDRSSATEEYIPPFSPDTLPLDDL